MEKHWEKYLETIYGDPATVAKAGLEIEALVRRFRPLVSAKAHVLSERDVVLITYGDSLREPGRPPLQTLNTFLDDYLAEVVTSVHILPFYPYSSDDGFSVVDYKAVDPELGDWPAVEALAGGYRLMFDAVINHLSQDSEWFRGYLAGDPRYAGFFIDMDPATDLSAVVRPRALPLLTPFEDGEGRRRHIWTTFSADQVDLNFANHRVLTAILDVLLFYVSKGARLLRLDAVGFLWKEPGTSCIHLPPTHAAIKLMRAVIHELAPSVVMITETNVPHAENTSYFGNGYDEAQMVYNFTLPPLLAYGILTGDATQLSEWAQTLKTPSEETAFFNFTASHDGVGLRPVEGILLEEDKEVLEEAAITHGGYISYRDLPSGGRSPYELNCNYLNLLSAPSDPVGLKVRRMLLSQAVLLAMPGVPGIYIHSLLGSENDRAGVEATGRYRSINREKLDYEIVQLELEEEDNLRHQVFYGYLDLLRARIAEPAFHPQGAAEVMELHPAVFALRRRSPDGTSTVLALHNLQEELLWLSAPVEAAQAKNLLDGSVRGLKPLKLEGYGVAWLKL